MIKNFHKKPQSLLQEFQKNPEVFYGVDLVKVVIKTLNELSLSSRPALNIDSISKVAPDYFSGFSTLDEYMRLNELSLLGKMKRAGYGGRHEYMGKYTYVFNAHPFEHNSVVRWGNRCCERVPIDAVENIINARRLGIDVSTIRMQQDIIKNPNILQDMLKEKVKSQSSKKEKNVKWNNPIV